MKYRTSSSIALFSVILIFGLVIIMLFFSPWIYALNYNGHWIVAERHITGYELVQGDIIYFDLTVHQTFSPLFTLLGGVAIILGSIWGLVSNRLSISGTLCTLGGSLCLFGGLYYTSRFNEIIVSSGDWSINESQFFNGSLLCGISMLLGTFTILFTLLYAGTRRKSASLPVDNC